MLLLPAGSCGRENGAAKMLNQLNWTAEPWKKEAISTTLKKWALHHHTAGPRLKVVNHPSNYSGLQ